MNETKNIFKNNFIKFIIAIIFVFAVYLFYTSKPLDEQNDKAQPKAEKTSILEQIFNVDKLNEKEKEILENNFLINNAQIFKYNLSSKNDPMPELANIISKSYEKKVSLVPTITKLSNAIIKTINQQNLEDKIIFPESAIRLNPNDEPYPFVIIEFINQDFDRENFIKTLRENIGIINKEAKKSEIKIINENTFIYLEVNRVISHIIRFEPRKEKLLFVNNYQKDKTYFTIIIDDSGENFNLIQKFMELPFPVVFSVLPKSLYATKTATIAHEKGFAVFLHQPMEANSIKPTPNQGFITTSMSEQEMTNILQKNMILVPNIRGVNNHMGSKFTENELAVNNFISAITKLSPHILILDSLTDSKSKLYNLAREKQFLIAKRDFFIDNDNNIDAVINQSYNYAKKHGQAIIIGHARTKTLNALKKWQAFNDLDLIFCLPSY